MARQRTNPPPDQRPSGEVELSDPRALRAIAHPARLTIVEELYQGLERTASELAELTGLTPSAMSYHLRALERWGVVERAETRDDARERPWRAAGRSLTLTAWESGETAAIDVLTDAALERLREAFRRWSAVEGRESAGWRDVGAMRRSFLWLSEAEAGAFAAELRAVFEKYVADRDAAHHPPGTRRIMSVLALVPEVPET
jgi:DNA-binding transcriptional ArsR family regulator